jgi:cell division protein FtsZ
MIELAQEERDAQHIPIAVIKVVGVGGAGGNAINAMSESSYKDVDFIAVNTDAQALTLSKAHTTLQIGQKSTKGLGAGANPEVGKRAAEEDLDKVLSELHDADIVFLVGGTGGGTGSGALPVIVKALKEKGILTIAIVTKPFVFEGRRRLKVADAAIDQIREHADTLIVVPNQKLLDVVDDQVSMIEGFAMINDVLNQSVKGVSDIITRAGHINVDFADVREVMRDQGLAVMGTGKASGEGRARRAVIDAISSPLLENMSIAGARGVLLNISGSSSLGLHEISDAASVIYDQADENANIILGSVIDESLGEEVSVTVIATGFNKHAHEVQIKATMLARDGDKSTDDIDEPEGNSDQESIGDSADRQLRRQEVKSEIKYAAPIQEVTYKIPVQAAPVYQEVQPEVHEVQEAQKPQEREQEQRVEAAKEETYGTRHVQEKHCEVPVHQKEAYVEPVQERQEREEIKSAPQAEGTELERGGSELGSNVIQLKDLDVPTFMRKGSQDQQQAHHNGGKKKKKHKKNRNREQHNYNNQ